jgi:DNA-directed RNA polymerase specialized sigma24 family protein
MGRCAGDDREFVEFFDAHERRLRQAFSSIWGPERGRQVAIDALSFAWEHWDRVRSMDNPVGYVFVVGRDRSIREHSRHRQRAALDFPVPSDGRLPSYEPALPGLIGDLSERERQVVMLVHAYEWLLSEVAELLGVSKSTVQTHADRALAKLRVGLGVPS